MRKLIFHPNSNLALLTVIIITLISNQLNASSMVEVALRDPGDLEILLRGGFDVTYVSQGHLADVVVKDESELERLAGTGLRYIVSQRDIEQFLVNRNMPNRDPMGGFRTLAEIEAELDDMIADFPELISERISIGETIEGRDIWAVKISDSPNEDEDEPEVLFVALIHCREVITQALLFEVMHMLLDSYGEDERLTRLVDEREIWFIPCFNPDGYAYNEEINPNGGGMWRKNKRDNEDGTIGVDLNRNWGFEWGRDNIGSSPNGDSNTYRGTAPFSEPETQAGREFINERNFTITIFFHSYSNLCIIPPAYDYAHVPHRGVCMALTERFIRDNNYLSGTGWEVIYLVNGDSDDWIYGSDEHEQILPFTIEIGTRQDNFWPPQNRVQTLIDENIEACLAAMEFCDNPNRALPPVPPDNPGIDVEDINVVSVFWDIPEDEDNPQVSYDIMARIPGEPYVDDVSGNEEYWELFEASRSRFEPHSAPDCFRMEITPLFSLITTASEFTAPARLEAWMRLDLSLDANLALEVSENGYDWTALPGRNTQDIIKGGYNHGPGLKRINTEDQWEQFWWDFGEWEGRQVKLRFRYYHFRSVGRANKIYIDDIGPLPGIEWEEMLAEGVEDDTWMGEVGRNEQFVDFYVRARDGEGDVSFWSSPIRAEFDVPMFSLNLDQGWSMISAPILSDLDVAVIFSELVERDILVLIKNGEGSFYAPRFGFDQLGDWDPTLGYWIKVDEECEVGIPGERIPVDTPVVLNQNWNLIGYLPEIDMPAPDALASLGENLLFVKDDSGRFWSIAFNFNNMPDMRPGEGYLIKVTEADELIYPVDNVAMFPLNLNRNNQYPGFQPTSSDNHSLLLILKDDIPSGEIIARDREFRMAGLTEIEKDQTKVGIAVWGEVESGADGYATDEKFYLFWRANVNTPEYPITLSLMDGDENWQVNGFSVIEAQIKTDVNLPLGFGMDSVYPNPFNSSVMFSYQLVEQTHVGIQIFDSAGRNVDEIQSDMQSAGSHQMKWNGMAFPSGVYIARLEARGDVTNFRANQQIKLLLIR